MTQASAEHGAVSQTSKTRAISFRSRYAVYIASEAWRRSPARLRELELSAHRCRLCARGEPTVRVEVHHRVYRKPGHELPSDLCTLCSECHRLVTTELRRRRYAHDVLPGLVDTPRMLPDRHLIDRTQSQ